MAKANQTVTWPVNANVAPGSVRKESDVMSQVAAAYEAVCDLAVTGNGAGSETGYQVDFYAQFTNTPGVFEVSASTSRLRLLGSIVVDVTTFPLILPAGDFEHMPTEYKIVVLSSAVTDTVTVDVTVRADSP